MLNSLESFIQDKESELLEINRSLSEEINDRVLTETIEELKERVSAIETTDEKYLSNLVKESL